MASRANSYFEASLRRTRCFRLPGERPVVLLALLAIACGAGTSNVPEPSSESANMARRSVTSARPGADAGAPDAGRDAAPPTAVHPVPVMDVGLHTVLLSDDAGADVQLAPLENTMFVHDAVNIGRLDGRDLIQDGDLLQSRPGCLLPDERISMLGGRWPDATYLAADRRFPPDELPGAVLYRWQRDRWARLHPKKEAWTAYAALLPWGRSGVVGAVKVTEIQTRYGILTFETKVASPFTETLPHAKSSFCATRLDASALAVTGPSLFAVGWECPANGSAELAHVPAVESFERGRKEGTYRVLPHPSGTSVSVHAVHALAPNDVYAGGEYDAVASKDKSLARPPQPYLVHFDGESWKQQQVPILGGITSLASEEGSIWATAGFRLWKRDATGSWVEARLPEGFVAERVVVQKPGDIWLQGRLRDSSAVLRSIAPGRVLGWHTGCFQSLAAASAADADCSEAFVVLEAAPPGAPPDYGYPAVAKLVAEGPGPWRRARLYETKDRGQRYLGALTRDFAVGETLRALATARLGGKQRRFVCAKPVPSRELHVAMTGAAADVML